MPKKKRRKRKKCVFSLCCTANVSDSDEDTKELENVLSNVCSQAQETGSTGQDLTSDVTETASLRKNKNALKQKYKSVSKEAGIPPSKETGKEKKRKNGPWGKIRASLAKFKGNNGACAETVPVQMPTKKIWTFSEVFKSQGSRVSIEKINENASREQTKRSISQASDGPELSFERLARSSSREAYVDESSDRRMCRRRPRDTDSLDKDISEATQIQVLMPAIDENMTTFQNRIQPNSVKDISNESIESVLQSQKQTIVGMKQPEMEDVELSGLQREDKHSSSPEHSCQAILKEVSKEKTSVESEFQCQKTETATKRATEGAKPTDVQKERRLRSLSLKKSDQAVVNDIPKEKKPGEIDLQCQKPATATKRAPEVEVCNPTDVHKERRSRSLSLKKSDHAVVNVKSSEKKSVGSDLQCQKPASASKRAPEMEVCNPTDVHKERRSRSSSLKKSDQAVVNDIPKDKKPGEIDLQCQKPATATKRAPEVEVCNPTDVHKERRSRSLSLKKRSQAVVNDIPKEKKPGESDLQCQKPATATNRATEVKAAKPTDVQKERRSRSLSLKKSDQAVVNDKSSEKKSVGSDLQCQKPASASKRATEVETAKPTDYDKERRSRSLSLKKSDQAVVNDIPKEKKLVETDLQCQKPASAAKRAPEVEVCKPTDVHKERRSHSLSLKKSVQAVVNVKSSEKKSVGSDLQCQKPASAAKRAPEMEVCNPTDVHKERRSRSSSLKKSDQAVVNDIPKEKKLVESDLQCQKPASAAKRAPEVEVCKPTDVHKERRSHSLSLKKSDQAVVNVKSSEKKSVGSDLQCQKPASASKRAPEMEVCNPTDVHKERRSRSSSLKKSDQAVVNDIPKEKKPGEIDLQCQKPATATKRATEVRAAKPTDVHKERRSRSLSLKKRSEAVVNGISKEKKSVGSDLQLQCQKPATAKKRATEVEAAKPNDVHKERRSRSLSLKKSDQAVVNGIPKEKKPGESDLQCQKPASASKRATEVEVVKPTDYHKERRSRSVSLKKSNQAVVNDFSNVKKFVENDLQSQKQATAIRRATEVEAANSTDVHNERRSRSLSLKKSDQAVVNACANAIIDVTGFIPVDESQIEMTMIQNAISYQVEEFVKVLAIQASRRAVEEQILTRNKESDERNEKKHTETKIISGPEPLDERDSKQNDIGNVSVCEGRMGPEIEFGEDPIYSKSCKEEHIPTMNKYLISCLAQKKSIAVKKSVRFSDDITIRRITDFAPHGEYYSDNENTIACISEEFENEKRDELKPIIYTLNVEQNHGIAQELSSLGQIKEVENLLLIEKKCVKIEEGLLSSESRHSYNVDLTQKDKTSSGEDPIVSSRIEEKDSVNIEVTSFDKQAFILNETKERDLSQTDKTDKLFNTQSLIQGSDKHYSNAKDSTYSQETCISSFRDRVDAFSVQASEGQPRDTVSSNKESASPIRRRHFVNPSQKDEVICVEKSIISREIKKCVNLSLPQKKRVTLHDGFGCLEDRDNSEPSQKDMQMSASLLQECVRSELESRQDNDSIEKEHISSSQGKAKACTRSSAQKAENTFEDHPVIFSQSKEADKPILLLNACESLGSESVFLSRQIEHSQNADEREMSKCDVDLIKEDKNTHEQLAVISIATKEEESCDSVQYVQDCLVKSFKTSCQVKESDIRCRTESQGNPKNSLNFMQKAEDAFNEHPAIPCQGMQAEYPVLLQKESESIGHEPIVQRQVEGRWNHDVSEMINLSFEEESLSLSLSNKRHVVDLVQQNKTPQEQQTIVSTGIQERESAYLIHRDEATSEPPIVSIMNSTENKERIKVVSKESIVQRFQGDSNCSEEESSRSNHFTPRRNPDFNDDFVFKEDSSRSSCSREGDKVHRIQISEQELKRPKHFTLRKPPDLNDDFDYKDDSTRSSYSLESDKVHRFRGDSNGSEEEPSRSKQLTPQRNPDLMDDFVYKKDSTRSSCSSDGNKVLRFQSDISTSEEKPITSPDDENQKNPKVKENSSISFEKEHINSSQGNTKTSPDVMHKPEHFLDEHPAVSSQIKEYDKPIIPHTSKSESIRDEPIVLRQVVGTWNPDVSEMSNFSFETESLSCNHSKERDKVQRLQRGSKCSDEEPSKSNQFIARRNPDLKDDFVCKEESSRSSCSERDRVHRFRRDSNCSEKEPSRSKQLTPQRNPDLKNDFVYKEDSTRSSCSSERDKVLRFQRDISTSEDKPITSPQVEKNPKVKENGSISFEKEHINSSQGITKTSPDVMQKPELFLDEHPAISSQIKESDKPIIPHTSKSESIRDEPIVLRQVVGTWNPDVSEMSNFSFETESLSCNHSKERDKVQRLQSNKCSDEELSRSNQFIARRNPDLMDDFVFKEDSSRSSRSDKVHRFRIESNCYEEQLNRSKQFTPRRKPDFDDDFVFKEDSTRSSCSSDRDKVHRFRNDSNSSEEQQSRRNQFTPRRNPDLMEDFVFKEDSTQSSCSNERDNVPRLKSRAAQFTPRRNTDLEDDFVFKEDSPQSSCSNERDNLPKFKDQATQFTPRRNADSVDDFVFREDSSRSNTSKEGENKDRPQRYIDSSEEEPSRSNQFIPRRGPDLMDDFVNKENSTRSSSFKERNNENFIQVKRTSSGEKVIDSKEKDEDSIGFVQRFADIFNKLSMQPSQFNGKDTSDLTQEKKLSHEEHPLINERDKPRTVFAQGFLKDTTNAGEHERPADIQNKKKSVIDKSVRFSEDHRTWILGDSMLSDVDCGYNKDKVINIQQIEHHRDMLIQPVEHKTMKKGKLPKLQCEKRNGDEVPVGKTKGAAKSGKKLIKKATKPFGKVKKSASWTDVYSDDTDYELDSDVFCSDDDQPPKASTEKPSIPAFTLGYQKLPSISKGSPTS